MRVRCAHYWGVVGICIMSGAAANVQADELKCEGPFARDADHQRLVTVFAQANVVKTTLYQEAEPMKASILFPKDPSRRVEVLWWNETARKSPSSIQAEGSGWFGPKGIRVGMTLDEVEALNGRPFTLYGFGWDFGGTSSDWKGGALASLPGGCNLFLIFALDETADEAAQIKVSSDSEYGSDQSEIKAVRPKVERIGIAHPQKQ